MLRPGRLLSAVLMLGTVLHARQSPIPSSDGSAPSGAAPLQSPTPTPTPPSDVVRFRTGADVVVLHVSVRDRRGRDIDNLPASAFAVTEDDVAQPITLFTNEDAPVTVGLVIDSSVSMLPIRDQVIAAATAFAEASHPRDDMFALAFNERVRPALPPEAPFTADPVVLRSALMSSIEARGRTTLFDAVSVGLDYVARGQFERRMLVVISDGGDNASRTPFDRVMAKVQASNAVIFTVALQDPYAPGGDMKTMRALADASGGQTFSPRNMKEVVDALTVVAHELRHSYTIGYAVPHADRAGFRRIHVDVTPSDGQRVTVRTRAGYRVGDARENGDVSR
jgi:VWFA-related protein